MSGANEKNKSTFPCTEVFIHLVNVAPAWRCGRTRSGRHQPRGRPCGALSFTPWQTPGSVQGSPRITRVGGAREDLSVSRLRELTGSTLLLSVGAMGPLGFQGLGHSVHLPPHSLLWGRDWPDPGRGDVHSLSRAPCLMAAVSSLTSRPPASVPLVHPPNRQADGATLLPSALRTSPTAYPAPRTPPLSSHLTPCHRLLPNSLARSH